MIDNIETPVAIASVTWLPLSAGGRTSGPPTASVYAANCAFPGGEHESDSGGPATAEKFSIFIQKVRGEPEGAWICEIDFVAPDLVAPYLRPGAQLLVMEGPKVVGHATIQDVFGTG